MHPITPYFHYPTFDRRYRRFWFCLSRWSGDVYSSRVLNDDPDFLPLLLAVLYYGSVIEPLVRSQGFGNEEAAGVATCPMRTDIESLPSLLLTLSSKALAMTDFPNKKSLSSLTAFMLLQMDQLRSQDTSACSFVAVAIRVAQSMGLDKSETNDSLGAVVAEERQRIWALLSHLDVLTARRSGLPPILGQRLDASGNRLCEARDEYIGTPFAGDPRHAYPAFLLAHGRYEASAVMRVVLARQVESSVVSVADVNELLKSVQSLQRRLEQRIARIHAANDSNTLPFTAPGLSSVSSALWADFSAGGSAFSRWSESTLRYIIEQAYCDLYSLALADAEVWDELRDECDPLQ